ncbi:asparagine synthase-domain-containing protein [Sporodiniella umbellata]|nr:asparagine synthase-domain-containing protein [Sporodiniella umbellata]
MCGILFSLSNGRSGIDPSNWESLKAWNTKRGPDSQMLKQLQIQNHTMQFFSTVLHLRGPAVVPQPFEDSGNILCWNGEAFGGIQVPYNQNDTEVVMSQLKNSKNEEEILSVFSRIEGPFAFVYWEASSQKLWFGRDCLGRRSLLIHHKNGMLQLSSVGLKDEEWKEVEAKGIYCIDLSTPVTQENRYHLTLFNWSYTTNPILPFPKINPTVPNSLIDIEDSKCEPTMDQQLQSTVSDFISVLSQSVKSRVADIPHLKTFNNSISYERETRVAILFSGGIDCTVLAVLADQHLPKSEPIDLLNVAFENPRSENAKKQPKKSKNKNKDILLEPSLPFTPAYDTPDRVTGRASLTELKKISPERTWNFVEINVPYNEAVEYRQHIIELMFPLDTIMDLSIAMAFWFASRGKGTIKIDKEEKLYHSSARVLISGLGADEQLGGYSRHREAFRHGSWERLITEVKLEGN